MPFYVVKVGADCMTMLVAVAVAVVGFELVVDAGVAATVPNAHAQDVGRSMWLVSQVVSFSK